MIIGLGNDICNQERIARSLEKFGDKFAAKILGAAEMDEWRLASDKVNYVAKKFAAKEAIYKATAHAISPPPSWHDATITHDDRGRPIVSLSIRCHNALQEYAPSGKTVDYHLTLSDELPYIYAVCLVSVR